MKIAINYSPQAAVLVSEGRIDVDLFKCPAPWDTAVNVHDSHLIENAAKHRPVYLHFPLNTCDGSIEQTDLSLVENALAATNTPYVNVHLQAKSKEAHGEGLIVDAILRDLERLVARFGAERVIAENVVYSGPQGKLVRECVEPDTIRRVLDETGCGLLLDTAHARLTASALGMDTIAYLDQLPLDRLRELHVTGTRLEGHNRDSMSMTEDDWAIAAHVAALIGEGERNLGTLSGAEKAGKRCAIPWAVAFEYGGLGPIFDWRSDPEIIATQLPRLCALFQKR